MGKLVKSLKSLDSRDFNSSGTSSSDGSSVSEILAQIGLETEANDKSGSMSLGRLITILEKNIDGSINQSAEVETATASIAKLINGLTDSADSSKLLSLLNNNSSGSESDKKADLKKLIMAVSEASNQDTALASLRALVSGAGISENSALKKLVKSMSQDSNETEALTTLHTFNSAESNLTAEERSAIEKFLTGLSNKSETGKNSLLNFFNNAQNIGTDSVQISDLTSEEKSDIEKLLNGLSGKGHNAETSLLNAFKNLKGNTSESGSASSNESEINTDLFSGPTVGSLLSGIVNSAKNIPEMSVSSDSTFNDAVSSSRSLMTKIKLGDTSESTDAINNKGINNSEKNKNSRLSKEKSQNDTLKSFQEHMSGLTGVQEKTTDQTDLEYISQNAGNIIETENIEKRPHKNLKNTDILETAAKIYDNTSSSGTLLAKLSDEQVSTRPILPAYVSNQAAKGILKAAAGNENEIVINIKPPELGRMQIKIENTDAGIKVQIVTEKNMASDILNSNKNDIAAYLADAGIKVEKLDIQLSFNFDQTMSSFKEQAHNESGRRRNRKNDDGSHEDTADNSSPDDENMTIEDRVSLTA
jgi:flagellar hook-length control protein FliK